MLLLIGYKFKVQCKQQQMKRVLKEIKGGILKLDLFKSGSLLRVKGEPEHKTVLGGMVSLTVIVMLLAVFYNRIIDTFDKVLISSSASDNNANDPSALNLTTVGSGPFMLGAEVYNHNLNEGSRYFDVVMTSYQQKFGTFINSIEIRTEPCTPDHWSGYPDIQAKFEPLNMAYWKCMPKDSQFQIQGKYTSQKFKSLSIEVRVCSNNSYDSRPCAPQAQIDQFFDDSETNYFTVYFINPLINPESQDYLTYYLDDTNYLSFSYDYGGEALIYVDDYSIATDNSILPLRSIQTESGGIVTKPAIKNTFLHITDTYVDFNFYKSSTSNNITRSYEKLDNVFSYIGGLFGTVLIFFFLLSSYNTYKFEVNLAGYLYRTERKGQLRAKERREVQSMQQRVEGHSPYKIQKDYNFLHFLGQSLFQLLQKAGCRPQWQRVGRYHRVREQMLKQLDVLFLIKRLNFLQKSISFLFTAPQLKALHLSHQLTMADAVATRRNYKLRDKLQREIQQLERLNSSPSSASKQSLSKNDSSNQFVLQANNTLKPSFDPQQATKNHFPLDSDNYSSEDSSSQQQDVRETSLLREMAQLQNEKENKISRRIWQDIDIKLRQMIKRFSPHIRLKDTRQNQFQNPTPQIISFNNLVPESFSESNQSEELQSKAELTEMMFARIRTVKVERVDEQIENQA